MARRKALLFSDVARFVDYVRLGSPKSSSTKGFELIEVTWPTTDQRGLVLLGHRARPWSLMQRISRVFRSEPGEAFDRIEVIASDEALIWQDSGKPRPLTIHSRRGAHELIDLVAAGTIHTGAGRQVLEEMLTTGRPPAEIVAERGREQVRDDAQIEDWCRAAIAGNEKAVSEVRAGNDKAIGALMGKVMQVSGGNADPQLVRTSLARLIAEG